MIILPDKNRAVGQFIMPLTKRQWIPSSQALPKDDIFNWDQTRYRMRARLHDGFTRWCGWFDDREDFDAFLFAMATGRLEHEPGLWSLPTPHWHPDLSEGVQYDFATVTFLSTTPGTIASYTSPVDWNNGNNTIEGIGAGGSGQSAGSSNSSHGAGGGAYARKNNYSFAVPGVTTAAYMIGLKGAQQFFAAGAWANAGIYGGDTWFGAATFAASAMGAKGGPGDASVSPAASVSIGDVKYKGGDRGLVLHSASSTGAGGAAGPDGAGENGVNTASTNAYTDGGRGNAGLTGGGAKGLAGGTYTGNPTDTQNGQKGTYWDATHGPGGAGAGRLGSPFVAGYGGNYGGGGGAIGDNSGMNGKYTGMGADGLIVVTYTPMKYRKIGFPMLGF